MTPLDKPELRKERRYFNKTRHALNGKPFSVGDGRIKVHFISLAFKRSQMKKAREFRVKLDRQLDMDDICRRIGDAFKDI